MSPRDLTWVPEVVIRASQQTELALFRALARGPGDLETLRLQFLNELKSLGTRQPVYGRDFSSLDEYAVFYQKTGYISSSGDEPIVLTERGRTHFNALELEAEKMHT